MDDLRRKVGEVFDRVIDRHLSESSTSTSKVVPPALRKPESSWCACPGRPTCTYRALCDVPNGTVQRPGWDSYFLHIAEAVSARSSCQRAKVGAVVVKDRRIRASGYNDSPAGEPGCESCPRRLSDVQPGSDYDSGPGQCVSIHAEANALIHCNREDLVGATLYVTREPCYACAKLIKAARIERVVTPSDLEDDNADAS